MTDTFVVLINNKPCNSFTVPELKDIARLNKVNIESKDLKKDICRKLVMCGVAKLKSSKPAENISNTKKRFENTQDLLDILGVSSVIDLLGLYNGKPGESKEYIRMRNIEEMDKIIEIADIKKKKEVEKLSYILKEYKGEAKVDKFLSILAEKYCTCVKKLESKGGNALCTRSVFATKGLKGPGSAYQCEPIPLLLAPKGKKIVLEKLI